MVRIIYGVSVGGLLRQGTRDVSEHKSGVTFPSALIYYGPRLGCFVKSVDEVGEIQRRLIQAGVTE